MKIRIGTYSIDFNDEAIRKTKKESFVKSSVKSLLWTGIDREVLTEMIGEVFDTVKKAKK